MKYKVGDRVRIKSLDWYNENCGKLGVVNCKKHSFTKSMTPYCGCILSIIVKDKDCYWVNENGFRWTDEMIEGIVEEENKPKFKVGDEIISDVLQQKWKVIDVERTGYKLLSVDNSDIICGMDFKNEQHYKLVENEMSLDKAGQITDFEYEGLVYTLPEGYIFKDENGNVINATKIVLEKKKKEYPKTYEECCDILQLEHTFELNDLTIEEETLFKSFIQLKRCRDAYWKIYGEEMGLGKPWEPEFDDLSTNLECFTCSSRVFSFPTAEMRDAFKENFDPDLEICKEFL